MSGTFGVFIRCDSDSIRDCLEALKSFMRPSETFGGARKDDTHGGLKVFFKNAVTARNILSEQYLLISGSKFSIHPLTTTLIVHSELFDVSEDFEEVLRNGMKHLGSVLTVSRLSLIEELPDVFTGDWKVVLDVPEIEDLILNGLSNNMTLTLPGYEKGFPVTFCCSFCDEDGHTLRNCQKTGNVQDGPQSQAVTQSSRIDSVSNEEVREATSSSSQRGLEFRIRDSEEAAGEGRKPTILPKAIESWASEIGEEKVRQEFISRSFNSTKIMKSESGQFAEDRRQPKKRRLNGDLCQQPSKHPREHILPHIATPSNGRILPVPSTSKSNDINIVYELNKSPDRNNSLHTSSTATLKPSNQEDAGQVPTSSLPEGSSGLVKSELPSTDENDSDSNQGNQLSPLNPTVTDFTPRKRKPPQNRQITIPEGIRTIIRQNPGVLSEDRLEAFFNHVKKKSCPGVVAHQYTENVEVLKAQLQGIKHEYYNTPIIHSAGEKYFMKWFENVLERFDRKPTRKPRN